MKMTIYQTNALLVLLITVFSIADANGQGTSINPSGTPPDASAVLDVNSSNAGFLMPRLTTAERDAIGSPALSLLIFNVTTKCLQIYIDGQWQNIYCSQSCPVPPAPTAATHQLAQTQITWNWDTIAGATGYKYNTANDYATATDNAASTTYTQTGLACDSTYTLYVWAYDSCGNSPAAMLTATTSSCAYICGQDGTFVDARDGQVYGYVDIGNQRWMCQNLNYGTEISVSATQTNNGIVEKYCNDCPTYGGLYLWDEAMQYAASSNTNPSGVQGVCPTGWHLPSDAEWCELENAIEPGTDPNCNTLSYRGTNTGGKMKETGTVHWTSPNTGATNASGFTALPGGFSWGGSFSLAGNLGHWWSAMQYSSSHAWSRSLEYTDVWVSRNILNKLNGFSVRCVQD